MRESMGDLVARVRRLIDDPAGVNAAFSDDDLQDVLDANRTEARYARLSPVDHIEPGGQISYLQYRAQRGNWEANAELVDGRYNVLAPDTAAPLAGVWAFAAHQSEPVYITGHYYDLYSAAADALDMWAAREKGAFDFTADGLTVKRSQLVTGRQALARRYRTMTGPTCGVLVRGDVNA